MTAQSTGLSPIGFADEGWWRPVVQAYIDEEEKQIAKFWGERKFDLVEIHRQRSIAAAEIFGRLRQFSASATADKASAVSEPVNSKGLDP